MIKPKIKQEISDFIQEILQEVDDDELPKGEISFILHIDGREGWSWANIRNDYDKHKPVPEGIKRNLQF